MVNKTFNKTNPPLRGGQGGVIDSELQNLINLSGLKESFIAEKCGITPQYFSMLKNSARSGANARIKVKLWLTSYIQHSLNFKLAA